MELPNFFSSNHLSYSEIGMLAPLTRAYINREPSLLPLITSWPSADGVHEVIQHRAERQPVNRAVLVDALNAQNAGISLSKSTQKNIALLAEESTYTVTTGHQLNLFTGPAYFLYKIISVIESCKILNEKYAQYHFVPVYWMASEDHDFEEIQYTYVHGSRLQWNSSQTGAVGRFELSGMDEVLAELETLIGGDAAMQGYLSTVKQCYTQADSLAQATRMLVNAWFGKYGLVVVDGDSAALKNEFKEIVKKELVERPTEQLVNETLGVLSGYKAQVNPRDVNLFYLSDGGRHRISVFDEDQYTIVDTHRVVSRKALLEEVDAHPERFSPNALLRPVYQETILPNVWYIGGGAEVAYWLELKSTFHYFNISYPLISVRNAVLLLPEVASKRRNALGISQKQLFSTRDELIHRVLDAHNTEGDALKEEFQKVRQLLSEEVAPRLRPGIQPMVAASKARIRKEVTQLEKRVFKQLKLEHATTLRQLDELLAVVFPGGTFQERRVNALELFQLYGVHFIDMVAKECDPFCQELTVLEIPTSGA